MRIRTGEIALIVGKIKLLAMMPIMSFVPNVGIHHLLSTSTMINPTVLMQSFLIGGGLCVLTYMIVEKLRSR